LVAVFRIAKLEDAENISAIMMQVWLHTYAKQGMRSALSHYVFTEFNEEKIVAGIKSVNEKIFVYELNQHIVGVATLNLSARHPITQEEFPEIGKLYIQEYFTNKGIGSKLLNNLIEYCRKKRYSKIWLTVNHQNQRAIEFYKNHAFKKNGVTHFKLEEELHENLVLCKSIV
jgi:ribosomal protein S18 acetylase RimI-like enzyme